MKTQKKVTPEQKLSTDLSKRYRRKSFHVFGIEILRPNKHDELRIESTIIVNNKGIAVDSILVKLERNKYAKKGGMVLSYPVILPKGKSTSSFLTEFKKQFASL